MSEAPTGLGDRLFGRLLPDICAVCGHSHLYEQSDPSSGMSVIFVRVAQCPLCQCCADQSRYTHGTDYCDPLDLGAFLRSRQRPLSASRSPANDDNDHKCAHGLSAASCAGSFGNPWPLGERIEPVSDRGVGSRQYVRRGWQLACAGFGLCRWAGHILGQLGQLRRIAIRPGERSDASRADHDRDPDRRF